MMKTLLVPNNLYCNRLSCCMVSATQYLAKRTLPKAAHDFVTVAEVVMVDDKIIAAVIIVAVVVRQSLGMGLLLLATSSNVIH